MTQEDEVIENQEVNDNQEQPKFTVKPADEVSLPTEEIKPEESEKKPELEVEEKIEPEKTEVLNQIEINSENVLKFLKENGFENATSLEDLKPKELKALRPEVEKYNEFVEKTGNADFNSFLETQKDWSAESDENKLIALLKIENPDLSNEEIDYKYNKLYAVDVLEQDDKSIVMEKGINAKTDLRRANETLAKRQQEFMVPKGFENIPDEYKQAKEFVEQATAQQQENKRLIEEANADFTEKTNSVFTDDFEGFKFKVGNEKTGFEELTVKPENIQETRKTQANLDDFNKKFFDENGKLKDPKGFHQALYFGMNAEKIAEHFYNLGKSKQAESDDKLSKNIQTITARPLPNAMGSNITVKEAT
jgi:hypothetical protein